MNSSQHADDQHDATRPRTPRQRRRGWRRATATALLAVAALLVPAAAALADANPPARVGSVFESSWGVDIRRDCGYSRALPNASGTALWLFCDTPVYNYAGQLTAFIPGSSAAEGPYTAGLVPTGLSEVQTPPAALQPMPSNWGPAQFLPTPTGLTTATGQSCGASGTDSYAASWISGVAREPATAHPNDLLITYTNVCVTTSELRTEGFGLAEYNPGNNTIVANTTVHTANPLPAAWTLGSPVFSGGYLYLYANTCTATYVGVCTAGSLYLARVGATPSSWQNAGAYRFFDGTPGSPAWTATAANATSIISGATPTAVTADTYSGHGVVIVEQTDIGGGYRLWSATSPAASYTQIGSGRVPCTGGQGFDLCRALIGHPELSTSSALMLSYFNPGDQHVEASAVGW